jgi:hypothetical protein
LQKLEHCSGESVEKIQNHIKLSKQKVEGFGIDPNFCEAVTVAVFSLTGQLGNLAADHADELF